MAASVLGKRQRRAVDAEESCLPIPIRKRRARNTVPVVLQEDIHLSKLATNQDAAHPIDKESPQPEQQCDRRPYSARILPSNRTVHNKRVQSTLENAYPVTKLMSTVCDENATPLEFQTPTTVRFKDALSNATPTSTKYSVKLPGKPLTPRTPRTFSSPRTQTVYSIARQLFTQSGSPSKLVGREDERGQLRSFVQNAIESKTGGCTYISGPPGTGKSALVEEIMQEFQTNQAVHSTNINCVSLKSAKDVFSKLAQSLGPTGKSAKKSDQAILANLFVPKKKSASISYLVFLDELDSLLDNDCEVLYHLFEWSLNRSSRLILIGIANALDLTDRFLPRLKARNLKPDLLPFLPYTAQQIASIITNKLCSTLAVDSIAAKDFTPFLHPAAIQLSSKKVASQTGDLRKAFNLVRRAIDQIERETIEKSATSVNSSPTKQPLAEISNIATTFLPTPPKSSPLKAATPGFSKPLSPLAGLTPESAPRATVAHIAKLSSNIFNNGTASRLGGLNLQQKAVLCSLIAIEKKKSKRDPFSTPSKSASKAPRVQALYMTYADLCNRDDGILHALSNTEFRDVVASLETLGLVYESSGRTSIFSPTRTPSRLGRKLNADEKQLASAVSEQEMIDSLTGPGGELLVRLMRE